MNKIDLLKKYNLKKDLITPDNYVYGDGNIRTSKVVRDGQWDEFLPIDEQQKRFNIETSNCTVFGALNCIEMMLKKQDPSKDYNFSERYIGTLAHTNGGNSPHRVAETIRKYGLIEDSLLPFDESIKTQEDYYAPFNASLIGIGKEWKKKWNFKHSWVFHELTHSKPQALMSALKTSPVGASVDARNWDQELDLYTKTTSGIDTHWITIYGYVENEYWKILDHYKKFKKKVAWDYDFDTAKSYYLGKKWFYNNAALDLVAGFIHGRG